MARNTSYVVAIELLSAAQGVDLRADGKVADGTRPVYELVRSLSDYLDADRVLAGEIEAMQAQVLAGALRSYGGISLADQEGGL
jgi:histidine ammonia-lyase